ncbi:MAG: NADH-quinone oxidoreductase subunit NuoB [Ardenticatenales bacterium]|nr:NADH-quinone oxidoreductase subunit NuoB [Ardenticatenales bacterium]
MPNKAVRDVVERYDDYIEQGDAPEGVWVGPWNNLIKSLDSLNGLYNWGRKSSIWPLGFGLACCAIEMICTGFARFDIARFGAELFRASPRQADVMIVSGTVTKKMVPQIVRLYNQMPEPRYVIAMGACATGGGPFKEGYNVVSGIDKYLPVDVYVPGCPPTPSALLQGLMTLQAKIEGQKLSEVPWYRAGVSEGFPVPVLGPDIFDPRQIPVIDARLSEQEEPTTKAGKPPKAKPAELPAPEVELTKLAAEFLRGTVGADAFRDEGNALIVEPLRLVDVCHSLRNGFGFDYLSNVTSVDYPDRFEVVYHIYSIAKGGAHIYLKVHVDRDDPVIPSLISVYRSADFQEREVYDMMGIRFAGHPNLKRILLWEGFEGFPLRKDWKEAYYEQEQKPFDSRWPEGYHVAAEDRNIWGKNVRYPQGWDPKTWKAPTDGTLVLQPEELSALSDIDTDKIILNIGPQHPSTHGVFHMRVLLDGETVVDLEPVMGYLHRNHEQIGERNAWLMNMPFTDRLDYLTGMGNNFGYAITVEKLMGSKVPERAEYIRVIMAELTRIASHLWAAGFLISDLGAFFTPANYIGEEREMILDLFEMTAGSRMMVNYFRFGGVAYDISDTFIAAATHLVKERLPRAMEELDRYVTANEIVQARTKGIGVLPRDEAINYGAAGPVLRASGVQYDVRKAEPYSIYDRFDFEVPVLYGGDIFDRYWVRMLEAEQSRRIVEQALRDLPGGPILEGAPRWSTRVPAGEAYGRVENPKGELGFYVVSDGGSNPYRYHVRSPSFVNLTTLAEMSKGHKVADVIGILGSLDIVLGEVDR